MAAISSTATPEVMPSAANTALLERLSEPATAANLTGLLDELGTLSGLLTVAGSFLARGEEVMDNVASSYHELAGAAADSDLLAKVADPAVLEFVSLLLGAVSTARATVQADPHAHELGIFDLPRATKDPDVRRGLGFTVALLKQLGRALDTPAN